MSFSAYPSYKNSGVERLGKVPAHWVVCTIKWRCLTITDGAHVSPETENGAFCFISTKDISGNKIDFDGCLRTSALSYEYLERTGCRPFAGDVLFSKDGTIGRTVVVSEEREFVVASSLIIMRPDHDLLDSGYLHYLCESSLVRSQVEQFVKGAGLPRLSIQNLLRVVGVFPGVTEQVAIAAFLDRETAKIDALIEEQQRLIALLKEKRQAVISHAVTKGLDPEVSMKDSGVEWLGEVPAHWEVKRLRFICHIGTGDADTADATENGDYPFFVRSPIIERIGGFTHDCEAVLTAGDGAGVGKVYHYYKGKFRAHQRVYIFSNFRGVQGRFFYSYLSEMFAKVVLEGTAKSTVESLRRPMIADFWMTVPPEFEQSAIIAQIDEASAKLDALIAESEVAVRLLSERRAALISAAVTGKIDVRGLADIGAEAA